jgi:hypothetical protein
MPAVQVAVAILQSEFNKHPAPTLPSVQVPESQPELVVQVWPNFGPGFAHFLRSQSELPVQENFEVSPAVHRLKAHLVLSLAALVPHAVPALPPPTQYLVHVPLPLHGVSLAHASPALLPPTHTPLANPEAGHVPLLMLQAPAVDAEQLPPPNGPHVPFGVKAPQVPAVKE